MSVKLNARIKMGWIFMFLGGCLCARSAHLAQQKQTARESWIQLQAEVVDARQVECTRELGYGFTRRRETSTCEVPVVAFEFGGRRVEHSVSDDSLFGHEIGSHVQVTVDPERPYQVEILSLRFWLWPFLGILSGTSIAGLGLWMVRDERRIQQSLARI